MSKRGLIGKEHNAHLDWLSYTWLHSDSPVCFLEGFPGTGKTAIARELLGRAVASNLTAVMITAPETEKDPTDDLLLDLAMELNSAGRSELAHAIENNRPLLDVLSTLVNDPILIIIDEFQRSMQGSRAITMGGFARVLSTLANRKWLKGRILLITNRLVERARWSEPYARRTLNGMSSDDAIEFLEYFAQEGGRIDEIPPDRRRDVVKALGGNPRAIRLLVSNLAYESLDELIGEQPEIWELGDREVSADLIEDLERGLLKKTLEQLPDNYILQLNRLSVLRKPFKRQAIERLFEDKQTYARFKEEMIDRFLMEQHQGWFNLHPIVREIGLQKLAQSSANLRQAHSVVAGYYTRHFEAKQIVGWGALGGHFVESRYHLINAGRAEDLRDIATRFQSYIFSTLSAVSPIPSNAEELDERIAVLSALLEEPGPKNLEYHLARLFQARNQRNDLRRALHHAYRARSHSDHVPSWLLCGQLLAQMERYDEAIDLLKEGIDWMSPGKAPASLYNHLARLLAELNRYDEAIDVLEAGIDCIPPDKAVVDLYDQLARLLTRIGKQQEAIDILTQGINCLPADKALVSLYDYLARLLAQMQRYTEAIDVLKQGLNDIPPDKNLVDLYYRCAELLVSTHRHGEAIAILEQGINQIPPDKALVQLYHAYGELLSEWHQYSAAIEVLKRGIKRIPSDKGIAGLYALCTEILFKLDRKEDAIELLKEGIARVPPSQNVSWLCHNYAKVLLAANQLDKAIEALWDGIRKVPTDQQAGLTEFLLLLLAARNDEHGLVDLKQGLGRAQSQQHLAQTLLYQLEGDWEKAAHYAEQARKSGVKYSTLGIIEAFSWLCIGELERALDACPETSGNERMPSLWLTAFIGLRSNNIEAAKQAIAAYDPALALGVFNIDESLLLDLWDRPSSTLRQVDLAYYFPSLPPALTGLPHLVSRVTYHRSALPMHFEKKSLVSNNAFRKSEPQSEYARERPQSMTEEYIDFDLHIDPNGHIVANSPEGQVAADISIEVPNIIRLSATLIEKKAANSELLKQMGQELYSWLFPSNIHTHFHQTEARARLEGAKIRLRLRIEAESIASLPLEFLYRRQGGYFLAVNPGTVLSRYLNLPLPPGRIRRRESPLHMLAIIANPVDQTYLAPDEWEAVVKETLAKPLKDGRMTLETVKHATRKEIRDALLRQKPDIIQFVGHGAYKDGKGYLALVDDKTDGTWLVDDERFANLYLGHDDRLGLISLATCESAKSDDPQGFLGIAPQLVQRGVPAVLSMQYNVLVKTAKIFLEDFYTSLAAGKPADWATQAGRNAVSQEMGLDNREFATPVLYMRARDGDVF